MTIEKDIFYINFINNKEISEATKTQYKSTLKKFCKSTNTTLEEIINNCKNQQNQVTEKVTSNKIDQQGNTIIEKSIINFDVNNPNSYIQLYLNAHINYCKNKGNKNNTINHDLIYITTFLKHYNIKIPKLPKFIDDSSEWTLLTKADLKFIMKDSTLTHEGLISLLKSTGMRLSDALNQTWGDFMGGTKEYHNCIDLYDFAENAPQNMICTFEFQPQKTERFEVPCITFCDPETSNLLLQILRKLIHETIPKINRKKGLNLRLSKNDCLFGSQKANFKEPPSTKSISDLFWRKNKKLKEHHINLIDERISKGELSIEDREKEISKIPKFHAHACRKFFSSMIARNCGNLRICAILEGHTTPLRTDSSYVKIDIEEIKEAYMVAIPDLSLENIETKTYTSEIRHEMENKIAELEAKNKQLESEVSEISSIWEVLNDVKERQDVWEQLKKGE